MPPPTATPTQIPDSISKNIICQPPSRMKNDQVTPPILPTNRAKRATTEEPKAEQEPVLDVKSDLMNIRGLVTCSICDQLLYEPFTIQCGHTYCYSCLCSWFIPNRRKKTCPECRTIIKQMPAPSFMIKQAVDVFVNRAELMPPDESVEQHNVKRSEEVAAVERDRNGPDGLFKGLFPARRQEPILDEADGVHRCPHCNTEYLGGPACLSCGAEIDGEDFFDFFSGDDLEDLEGVEHELQIEIENEYRDFPGQIFTNTHRVNLGPLNIGPLIHHHHHHGYHHHHHHLGHHHHDQSSITSDSDDSRDDENLSESDSDEDGSSLQGFVVDDESPESQREDTPRGFASAHVDASSDAAGSTRQVRRDDSTDDDSDEGGPIVNRSRRARWSRQVSSSPSVISPADDDSSASENGDIGTAAERLRDDGWSPLHENEQEREPTDNSDHSDDYESDTETIGNGEVGHSSHVRAGRPEYSSHAARIYGAWSQESDMDDDVSEDGMSSVLDRDGDTEMSVSPDARESRRNRDYRYDEYPESESSRVSTDEYEERYDQERYEEPTRQLGEGHALRDISDDPSDGSSEVHQRRRALNRNRVRRSYDPRISQIFAYHQDNMREGSHRNPTTSFDGFDSTARDYDDFQGLDFNHDHSVVRQPANSSRPRNRAQYQVQHTTTQTTQIIRRRRQSPSVTRVISSSSRPARVARQYVDRSNYLGR